MGCNCGGSNIAGSYLDLNAFSSLTKDAMEAISKLARAPIKGAEILVGPIATPDGTVYTGALWSPPNSNSGFLYVPLGAQTFNLSVSYDKIASIVTIQDWLSEGAKLLVSHRWKLSISPKNSYNRCAMLIGEPELVGKVDPDWDKESIKSCWVDCLKRHAGSCFAICEATGWGGAVCLACIGGSALCCKINCHC